MVACGLVEVVAVADSLALEPWVGVAVESLVLVQALPEVTSEHHLFASLYSIRRGLVWCNKAQVRHPSGRPELKPRSSFQRKCR